MRASPRVPAFPITAYAVCTGLGATTAETVAGLAAGATALRPPRVDLPFETVCAEVPALPALPPSFARYESPVARIAMQLHDELARAIAEAVARWGSDRVGVVLGTSVGGLAVTEAALAHAAARGALPDGYDIYKQHGLYAAAELLCERAGLRGPRYAVSTACSSGAKVFASAQRLIRAGVVDAVVVGGVDSLCQMTLRGFHALSVLSPRPCRPFGAGRDGMNLGEGGALFVVAREGDGVARLLGVGESSDAHHMSTPHPEGAGARAAMRDALAQAGLDAADVDHINAHGTGTQKNDTVEARVIREVFGAQVPVVSTKGATGHTLGAAGAIEAAFALVALQGQWIPGSLGAAPLDPEVTANVVSDRRALRCRVVLSNSFGFGGSNASLLVGEA
jgi:3-oxoacyl-[acyl-carrier-protein] synthase-1